MPRDGERAAPATLGSLAAAAGGMVRGDSEVVITDVTHDSRRAGPGVLFVAIRGMTTDGHGFVPVALDAGAAVCVEGDAPEGANAVVVPDTRAALGVLAAEAHGRPSHHLSLVGVTGTNGKTTVTHLVDAMATAAGRRSGVVGTVGARVAGRPVPVGHTTPEASDLQRLLSEMVDGGVEAAAIEVSSHAMVLGRVNGTRFDVAAFTNLTQDHLDFHGDMAAYEAAKASLFTPEFARRAVVWIDDPAGARIAAATPLPVTSVGMTRGDVHAADVDLCLTGSSFRAVAGGRSVRLETGLAGAFNVANVLVAAACAAAIGIDWDSIAAGARTVRSVPGRFEIVEAEQEFTIVVDYAHTPDGVRTVIDSARDLAGGGRVIAVVGAGGDRDRAKRVPMGAAAARADLAVLTSDNPRSEDPEAIIDMVAVGAAGGRAEVIRDADRRSAIRTALGAADAGDVVLILGKGHEQGQQFADRTVAFDDRVVAVEEAAALGGRR